MDEEKGNDERSERECRRFVLWQKARLFWFGRGERVGLEESFPHSFKYFFEFTSHAKSWGLPMPMSSWVPVDIHSGSHFGSFRCLSVAPVDLLGCVEAALVVVTALDRDYPTGELAVPQGFRLLIFFYVSALAGILFKVEEPRIACAQIDDELVAFVAHEAEEALAAEGEAFGRNGAALDKRAQAAPFGGV